MPDNRITLRFSDDVLSAIDTYRLELFMTRTEFVRYCVQSNLSKLKSVTEFKNDSSSSSKDALAIKALYSRIEQLVEENRQLRSK